MAAARGERLKAMDATALVAELRALTSAGSSLEEQALCCTCLFDVSLKPTGAAAEDAVCAVAAALLGGVQHATLQRDGCNALTLLLRAAPAISVTAGVTTAVLAALRAHPGDVRVQRSALYALAESTKLDATSRTRAGAAGGVAAVVGALMRHPENLLAIATSGRLPR
jgi:hypothetical protein